MRIKARNNSWSLRFNKSKRQIVRLSLKYVFLNREVVNHIIVICPRIDFCSFYPFSATNLIDRFGKNR